MPGVVVRSDVITAVLGEREPDITFHGAGGIVVDFYVDPTGILGRKIYAPRGQGGGSRLAKFAYDVRTPGCRVAGPALTAVAPEERRVVTAGDRRQIITGAGSAFGAIQRELNIAVDLNRSDAGRILNGDYVQRTAGGRAGPSVLLVVLFAEHDPVHGLGLEDETQTGNYTQ